MHIYTIGYTKKTAETFFGHLREAGVKRIVDVRLRNQSQLAGFTKKSDLAFFLKEICGIDYVHLPELAPTDEIIDEYRKKKGPWSTFEADFLKLIEHRSIEKTVPRELLDGGCLLCSEDKPHRCHRRLIAEYLQQRWQDTEVEHLG